MVRGEGTYSERYQLGLTRLAVDIRVGTRVPAFSSSLGRAILSQYDEDRQRKELELYPISKITPSTETDLKRLLDILRETRDRGIAVVDQESVTGLIAIAAPIIGVDGQPIAAISLAIASAAKIGSASCRERVCQYV